MGIPNERDDSEAASEPPLIHRSISFEDIPRRTWARSEPDEDYRPSRLYDPAPLSYFDIPGRPEAPSRHSTPFRDAEYPTSAIREAYTSKRGDKVPDWIAQQCARPCDVFGDQILEWQDSGNPQQKEWAQIYIRYREMWKRVPDFQSDDSLINPYARGLTTFDIQS
jgi:hypothetical protein